MRDPMPGRSAGRAVRVWIANHYAVAPDRPAAAGSRHFDLARNLAARGHEVTIFAAGFSHLTGREERLAAGRLYRTEWFDGVRFVWLRAFPHRGNDWRRPLNMLSYVAAFLVVQTRIGRPDVVVGSIAHPFAAFGAWLAAKVRRSRFILEIRDLWPQTLVDLGALRLGSPGERVLRSLEAFLVRRASVVITLLPGVKGYLDEQGLPAGHVVYIPNGVDLGAFEQPAVADAATAAVARRLLDQIREVGRGGRFVIGYVGTFGRANRVDVIVRAAAIAEQQAPGRVGLILVGDGPERDELQRLAAANRAVAIGHPVPKRTVPAILRAMDGAVMHLTASPVYRYGISPNKLFEYMAAERPVVFACESAYNPVYAAGAGVTVVPDDPERLAAAFLQLAGATPEARAAMGAAGRDYVARQHNLAHLADAFAAVVEGRVMGSVPDGTTSPSEG